MAGIWFRSGVAVAGRCGRCGVEVASSWSGSGVAAARSRTGSGVPVVFGNSSAGVAVGSNSQVGKLDTAGVGVLVLSHAVVTMSTTKHNRTPEYLLQLMCRPA